MSEERRGIKESSDNMLVGLGKVFVGPLTELRNLEIGYHPSGLERVKMDGRWRNCGMVAMWEGPVTAGGSQNCQGLKFEPHR